MMDANEFLVFFNVIETFAIKEKSASNGELTCHDFLFLLDIHLYNTYLCKKMFYDIKLGKQAYYRILHNPSPTKNVMALSTHICYFGTTRLGLLNG